MISDFNTDESLRDIEKILIMWFFIQNKIHFIIFSINH